MSEQEKGERFSGHLMASRHRVYGFIYSLTQNHQASEDLLQEVSTILWRKFDQFEEGTDFAVWAMSVGRYCVLNWRRKQARLPLSLEDDDLMRLADEAISVSCEHDDLREGLEDCLTKLPDKCVRILRARYNREERVPDIAARQGKSVRSIYLLLEKAHGLLMDCIERRLGRSVGGEG